MKNLTRIKVCTPAHEIFEAFVDPAKIKHFWFSSGSARWEQGKIITLTYKEYRAQLDITIVEIDVDQKIVFQWGANGEGHMVTITLHELDDLSTVVEVSEEGFHENEQGVLPQLLDNKEGWVYMLTCLKAYVEFGVTELRAALVKDAP